MNKFFTLIVVLFLFSCTQPSSLEKDLLVKDDWPQKITGEIVIADTTSDDTGILWAIGWIEVQGSEDTIGIVFEGKASKLIDIDSDPMGLHNIWLEKPKDQEFIDIKIEKL